MKQRILSLFPATLIIIFTGCFIFFSFFYPLLADDFRFREVLQTHSIRSAAFLFYTDSNGRLASHFFLCTVFALFSGSRLLMFVYRLLMLYAFVFSLAFLLKNYLHRFRNTQLKFAGSVYWSAFITSVFFFIFFAGRMETWFWISATGVYLASLIISMNAFALLLKNTNAAAFFSALLFFLAGGFSESFALTYFVILLLLCIGTIKTKRIRLLHVALCMLSIAGGIALNVFSHGLSNRLGWLPEFHLLQALKNTLHSLGFLLLRWQYLPVAVLTAGLFTWYANTFYPGKFVLKDLLRQGGIVLAVIAFSFAVPCYVLSDIVPDRAASLGYLCGVLFLFDFFLFRKLN
ncbi:MAG TPA: hypothetical protein VFU15_00810 [Bacteroidia bacterium]|nr:hypothetical protein [Bacteroidia bacterium]